MSGQPWEDEDDSPHTKQDWINSVPQNRLFGDISEAWGWKSEPVALQCEWNDQRRCYEDVPENGGIEALASKPLGLSLALNYDGFQTFGWRGYTSSGVFISINNLPYHLRNIVENTLLVMIMPAPNEPTSYEFKQMMEPLMDELVELETGQQISVFDAENNRREQEVVHAHLSLARLDRMARIQVCGHAGTQSENNFCMYCTSRRSFLSDVRGFRDLPMRDPIRVLQDKSSWLNAPLKQKEPMRQRTGVVFTEFDRLLGWCSSTMCPPNPMDLIHLGTTKFILKSIPILPGMMKPHARQAPDESPLERANQFLD
ncbi:hypothetical protein FRC12_003166 [Ceratobasidium sp. 428]|nr:hypothetical protein FRC12_003166 [Ceratobasidium sp. 428]